MTHTDAATTPAPLTTAERLVIRTALLNHLVDLYTTALKLRVFPGGDNEPELRHEMETAEWALRIIER